MASYSQYSQFSIPQVNFRSDRWKPKELTIEAPDANITKQALALYEDRQNRFIDKKEAMKNKFQQQRANFGDDEETQAWFDSSIQKANDKIRPFIARGDMQGAMEAASDAGSDWMLSAETTARQNAWSEYKIKRDAVRSDKSLLPTTIERWEAENKFNTELTHDANGNVNGYKPYSYSMKFGVTGLPVADVNWTTGVQEVVGFASEKKNTTSDTNETENETYRGGQFSSFTATANGLKVVTERGTIILPYEKLHKNLEEWVNRNEQAIVQTKNNLEYEENKYRAALANEINPDEIERLQERLKYYKQFHDKYGGYKHTSSLTIAELFMDNTLRNAAKFDTTQTNVFSRKASDKNAPEDQVAKEAAARARQKESNNFYGYDENSRGKGVGVNPTHYGSQSPTDDEEKGRDVVNWGVDSPEEVSRKIF